MTPEEDRFWRIVIGTAIIVAIAAFSPQIKKFMHRIGYRDWREKPPPKDSDTTR